MRWRSIFGAAVVTTLLAAVSTTTRAQSAKNDPSPVLVELFTSEGCSSCPPADDLLRQINGRHTDSGRLIIGISEHVTYWNDLGWTDPYSSPAYTQRQDAYGERFHLDSVYTPQMVIDGEVQFVGSDSASLLHALNRSPQPVPLSLHIASAGINGNALSISFSVSGNAPVRGADIVAIIVDDADKSNVLRGENSGRNLAHVSVAREITRVATIHAATEQTVRIPLPAQFSSNQSRHLVLFAQTVDFGRVLGVDSRPL